MTSQSIVSRALKLAKERHFEFDPTASPAERRGVVVIRVETEGGYAALKVADTGAVLESGQLPSAGLLNEVHLLRILGVGQWPTIVEAGSLESDNLTFSLVTWLGYPNILGLIRLMRTSGAPASDFEPLAKAVFGAIARMHSLGVLHGDLQPEHFLYDATEHRAYVLDFGAGATLMKPGEPMYLGGMVHFLAPEAAAQVLKTGRADRSVRADLYSGAASLAYALTDTLLPNYPAPYKSMQWRDLLSVVASGALLVPNFGAISPRLADVLRSCLAASVETRPESADDVVASLSH